MVGNRADDVGTWQGSAHATRIESSTSVNAQGAKVTQMRSEQNQKVRATLYIPQDVLDEARNAVVHLAGYPVRMTLTKLAETALRRELLRLKECYNEGRDFPPRDEDLKGGRPIAATPRLFGDAAAA
jgi:hypothetical protein